MIHYVMRNPEKNMNPGRGGGVCRDTTVRGGRKKDWGSGDHNPEGELGGVHEGTDTTGSRI